MRKCILTGGTGFIGGALQKQLVNSGVEVTMLVRNANRCFEHLSDKIHIIEYDPLRASELELNDEYDCFYNMGWGGVESESKNDIDLQLGNIKCAVEALNLSKKINCKRFISAGTVAEYVFCDGVMDLNEKQSPNDYYGAAKAATHFFLDVGARLDNTPFNWVVIPSTYGEGRKGKNIITYTIENLVNGVKPQYGSLHQMWDFLYVEDVARALMLIGEVGVPGKTYGIGSGIYKPLKWYIETIRDIVAPGAELGIGEIPSMSTKTFSSCVNVDDLKKDTGFKPRYSFEEGIARTVQWYRRKENGQ